MKKKIGMLLSLMGAGLAALCCLGITAILASITALGLGFLIRDEYLFPIFIGFVGLTLGLLYASCREQDRKFPFWVGVLGGLIGIFGLWLLITGIYPLPWLIYLGLIVLFIATIMDFIRRK